MQDIKVKPEKIVEVRNPNFRPGTTTAIKEVVFNFIMADAKTAALGDMICWLPAIKFIAENYNYVAGHLIVPEYFMEVAQAVMREYPHWRIHTKTPERLNGRQQRRPTADTVNATHMHLIDVGFIYFAMMLPPTPEARFYPELDLEDVEMPKFLGKRFSEGPYAVMTPGATAVNRAMPPDIYNAISDHLISNGITPVHLGTTQLEHRPQGPRFDAKYDLTKGENLVDRTTLLEAAKIISQSDMVLGIDNGLLHLAGTTDAAIIFGFTMAGPNQRRIYRKHGHTMELYPDKKELACFSCQEHVRFFHDHNFTNCIYKENVPACTKILTKESWIAGIDMILSERVKDEETFNF